MRISRILSRYVAREILQYVALGLAVVATILLTQNLLQRLDELAAVGFAATDAFSVMRCLGGMLLAYAVPVAFLFGVLVAMGRLSADAEVLAMRSCGVGIEALLAPALVLGILTSVLTAWLMIQVEPAARRDLRTVLSAIASRGGVLEPGRFTDVGERILFVRKRDEAGLLGGILIFDRTDPTQPFTVFAERGRFVFDAQAAEIHLHLESGDVHFEPGSVRAAEYRRLRFEKFDYGFDASSLLSEDPTRLRPPDMTMAEIREVLDYFAANAGKPPPNVRVKTPEPYEIEMHRRFALPFAPVLFAMVAVPLGLRRTRGARSYGVLLCIALAFGYYVVLSVGIYLGERQIAPPALALWLPNLVFAGVGLLLLRRATGREV